MTDLVEGAKWLHVAFLLVGAAGSVAFLIRTRFWFPRYLHWMAGIASAIGLAMLRVVPEDAPLNSGEWRLLKLGLMVIAFPGLIYGTFILYGGPRAAYESRHSPPPCPYCGGERDDHGAECTNCGQTISPKG